MATNQPGAPPRKRQRTQAPNYTNNNNNNQNHNNNNHVNPSPQQQFHQLLGLQQINFFSDTVRSWIYSQCALSDNIEIEARLGRLLCFSEDPSFEGIDDQKINNNNNDLAQIDDDDNNNNSSLKQVRLHSKIGLLTPTIIDTSSLKTDLNCNIGFEATVSRNVFSHLNNIFNKWYINCNNKLYQRLPGLHSVSFPALKYERIRTINKIYSSDIRVIINMNNLNKIVSQSKKKKSSLNISLPNSLYDIRLTASIENIVPQPLNQIVKLIRCKDRISYKYNYFSIDITSTYTYSSCLTNTFINDLINKFRNKNDLPTNSMYGLKKTYEVELEIYDIKYLNKIRSLAAKKKQINQISQLSYYFTQASIKLAQVASNLNFTPAVCKLPNKNKK